MTRRLPLASFLLAATLLVAGCGRQSEEEALAELDNRIAANPVDPAVAAAIEGPIATDPALTQQSDSLAVRRTPMPVQAQYPSLEKGAPQPDPEEYAGCGTRLQYGEAWAKRLPAPFGLVPGGILAEAAGSERGDCHIRIVTFTAARGAGDILGWYRGRAVGAGYTAEQQRRGADIVLGGTRGDSAYLVIVTPGEAASEVALIVSDGAPSLG